MATTIRGTTFDKGAPLGSELSLTDITVDSGESLFLILISDTPNFEPYIGLPIYSGNPLWDGISADTWATSLDITASLIAVFYWNHPTPGTHDLTMTFAPEDLNTTVRAAVALTATTDDHNSDAGRFPFPPNATSQYQSWNGTDSGSSTDTHTAVTRTDNVFAMSILKTNGPETDTAGTWQNDFVRLIRYGTTGGPTDLTVDIATKVVPTPAAVNARVTGFSPTSWTFLSTETVLIAENTISLGGYTSYDLNRFDIGAPEAELLPEARKAIARGDLRHLPR